MACLALIGAVACAGGCSGSGGDAGKGVKTEPMVSGPIRFVPKKRLAEASAPAFPEEGPTAGPLPEPSSPEALATGPGAWSIVLASYPREQRAAAEQALGRVRAMGVDGAYVEERGRAVVVAFGEYRAGSDERAHRDLSRLRGLEVDGARPFEDAILAPPPFDGLAGTIPEYDLSTVKRRFGRDALYTLQIAAYQPPAGKTPTPEQMQEIRLAAERAAVELRREGDTAFYYHGPNRSMVTVGVFGDKEYDVQRPEREHPRITLLRRKYPHNLVNGATFLVRMRGQDRMVEQPSVMVAIPE
jgi:hypothetical protein